MDKPMKIKVLGQTVVVRYIANLKNEDNISCWGLSHTNERYIEIDKGLSKAASARVLRHEIFHMKLGISGLSELLPEGLEEALAVLAETD